MFPAKVGPKRTFGRSLVHTSFLPSSWNPDKNFALTGELGQAHMAIKNIYDFLPFGKMVIFVTESVIFIKSKVSSASGNFKNIFSRPLFTIIFRTKIVILNTDSILRVKTMDESVK